MSYVDSGNFVGLDIGAHVVDVNIKVSIDNIEAHMQDTTDRPYHHGDLRRTIIETAMAMLREDTGWQFTLREVARRARVSHTAPYKHFTDKSALLAEMAMIGFDRLRAALEAAAPAETPSPRDAFLVIARAYVDFGAANPSLYRLMFGGGELTDVHVGDRALGAFGVLVGFLERGQASGWLRRRPVQGQAAACWALVHGITMLSIDGLLVPEKVGRNALKSALAALLEGLES